MKAIQVSPVQAKRLMSSVIQSMLVPMLHGSPGIGKSDIIRSIARQFNLFVIDMRLAQCDPTDLLGFPTIVGSRADYMPMVTFPLAGDKLPVNKATGQPYDGWLLFFDELSSALPAIQAAAYKVVLDRMVGSHKLHERVAIMCAGNLETDNAIVQPMSTALQSRMVHFELIVNAVEWVEWAQTEGGIDHKITDFINFKPEHIYSFKPDHTDKTYSCPRTLEFANRHLKAMERAGMHREDRLPLLAGTLGEGVGLELNTFLDIYKDLPRISDILNDPDRTIVPVEPSIQYALTGSLAHNTSMTNCEAVLKYVSRLPSEFQVMCVTEARRRTKELVKHPKLQKWVADNAHLFR